MADSDNYLPFDAYHGAPASDDYPGFTVFQDETTGLHYFAMMDKNGHVVLKSEGYPSAADRDEGIASVTENRDTEECWTKEKDDEGCYMSLRAHNSREIARTCHFSSEGALLGWWMPFAAGSLAFGHADEDKSVPIDIEDLLARSEKEQALVQEKSAKTALPEGEGGSSGTNIATTPATNWWKWALALLLFPFRPSLFPVQKLWKWALALLLLVGLFWFLLRGCG